MNMIPAVAFSAWSGTGKTTIIEQLIARFKQDGLQVAAVKHDAHHFDIDHEGKDSWRFTHAGADMTILSSAETTAVIEQRSIPLPELLNRVHDVDLILVEGFHNEDLPRIGISRKETGKGFRLPPDQYIALVTDEDVDKDIRADLPVFAPDDIDGLAEFIKNRFV